MLQPRNALTGINVTESGMTTTVWQVNLNAVGLIDGNSKGTLLGALEGTKEGAVDGLAIGLAVGKKDGLAVTGALERTVEGIRVIITGAVVEEATGDADVQKVRPV